MNSILAVLSIMPISSEVATSTLTFEKGDMTFASGKEWIINIDQCATRGVICNPQVAATLWCQFKFGPLSVVIDLVAKDQEAGETWLLRDKVESFGKTFQWITCTKPDRERVFSEPEMGTQ